MFDKILTSVYTFHDLLDRLQFLKTYLKIKIFGGKEENFSSQDMIWLAGLGKDFLEDITKDNLDQTFADLEKKIKIVKPLVVFVPNELPSEVIRDIVVKLRRDYGPNFLVDLKVDPNLIAGCALVWNGIYKDYSLRGKMTEMRTEVLSILKKWK